MDYKIKSKESKRPENYKYNTDFFKTMDSLKDVNPAHAKHMLRKNQKLERFLKWKDGGVDLLFLPVCEHCEELAMWHNGGAYCEACGGITKQPITFLQYALTQYSPWQIQLLRDRIGEEFMALYGEDDPDIITEIKEDDDENVSTDEVKLEATVNKQDGVQRQ